MRLFGREPALWISGLYALLIMLSTFGVPGVDGGLAAVVQVTLTAVATAFTAWQVKPVAPTVFSGAVIAVASLLARFGLDLTDAQVGSITAAVAVIVTLIARAQITPVNDPRTLTAPLG